MLTVLCFTAAGFGEAFRVRERLSMDRPNVMPRMTRSVGYSCSASATSFAGDLLC